MVYLRAVAAVRHDGPEGDGPEDAANRKETGVRSAFKFSNINVTPRSPCPGPPSRWDRGVLLVWAYARTPCRAGEVETFSTAVPMSFLKRIEHQNNGDGAPLPAPSQINANRQNVRESV